MTEKESLDADKTNEKSSEAIEEASDAANEVVNDTDLNEAETQIEAEVETATESETGTGAGTGVGTEAVTLSEESADAVRDAPKSFQEDPPASVKKSGRGIGWLAMLLAIGGVAASGYLYYQLIYLAPLSEIQQELAGSQNARTDALRQIEERITQQADVVAKELAQTQEQQRLELQETQAGVTDSLQKALLAAPPSQREWKLAEAEYLLRIGNHRVLMEQDTEGALSLFLAVDQILAELDDFALHQVRAILADEIIALRQVERTDLQGIYLRLEAIKSSLDDVIFKTPEYVARDTDLEAEATVWSQLTSQLKEFVRVRRVGGDETIQPLLAPSEEQYLELNLRLALEQAQLAALKRQQLVFQHALENVRAWLVQYAEGGGSVLTSEIDELLEFQLERPVPNVSGSLNELHKVRQGGD